MKILFLNPPFLPRFSRSQRSPAVTKSGTLYYPIWLSYAAAVAQDAGFEIQLLDAPANNLDRTQVLKLANDFKPNLVVVDTSTPSIYNDIDVADNLKGLLPDAFILLVGTHVSALPDESLEISKKLDAVARGEYDFTVREIAEAIKNNKLDITKISGISFKSSQGIIHNPDRKLILDLNQLPMVSKIYKKHLNIKNYFFAASLYPEVQIITARGCPFKCFFCLWPQVFQGGAYRARSAQNVVEEFLYIKNELPEAKGIVIEDDTFTVDKLRVFQICDLIIKRKARLKWNANVRMDLGFETMKIMKAAGCYLIIAGIETSQQSILDNINKGLKETDIKRFFDNAKRAGLLVHAAFMAGNPGETKQTLKNTFKLAKKFMPDTVQFFPLTPYPGTKAYAWAKDNGYLKIKTFRDYLTSDGLHNCVIDLPGITGDELLRWCNESRKSFYFSLRYIIYKIMRSIFRPQEMIRVFKAFRNFRRFIFERRPA